MSEKKAGRSSAIVGREKVRKSNKFTPSSRAWLERQLNDPFVQQAKRDGYRSRAAYKLIEIDDKYKLFRPGGRVVDLGAAPGGWSQVAAKRVGRATGRGAVIGIDLLEIDPMPGVEFIQLDFLDPTAPDRLIAMLGDRADVVMSDMAANATGHKRTDHLKIMGLAETAIEFARTLLAPGGAFVAKVLKGGTENDLLADLKRDFALVRHMKPASSRSDSSELYVLATGYRGGQETAELADGQTNPLL